MAPANPPGKPLEQAWHVQNFRRTYGATWPAREQLLNQSSALNLNNSFYRVCGPHGVTWLGAIEPLRQDACLRTSPSGLPAGLCSGMSEVGPPLQSPGRKQFWYQFQSRISELKDVVLRGSIRHSFARRAQRACRKLHPGACFARCGSQAWRGPLKPPFMFFISHFGCKIAVRWRV